MGVLGGCSLFKESKFVGTWEEKMDKEKADEIADAKEFGVGNTEQEKQLIGEWKSDDGKMILMVSAKGNGLRAQIGQQSSELVDENDQVLCKANSSIYTKLKYDSQNNTIKIDALCQEGKEVGDFAYSISRVQKGQQFHKEKKERNSNFMPSTLTLNKDNTGELNYKGQRLVSVKWKTSGDTDSNTIVVTPTDGVSSFVIGELFLNYDTDKDVMYNKNDKEKIYYFENKKE